MNRQADQFDGENGCMMEPSPYPTSARLHGPALRGWRLVLHRILKWFSRRIERRENVVVAGPVRPDRR